MFTNISEAHAAYIFSICLEVVLVVVVAAAVLVVLVVAVVLLTLPVRKIIKNSVLGTGHVGPQSCETSRLPHFVDIRLRLGGEIMSLTRRPLLSQEIFLVLIYVRG
jgi:hypothetical protein